MTIGPLKPVQLVARVYYM